MRCCVTATYRITLRDAARRRVLEVDHYTQLDVQLRFNDVSGWILNLPAGSPAARAATTQMGLIVERDGVTVLSGPVTGYRRLWSDADSAVTLTGADDILHLRDALARPVPDGPPYDTAEQDVRSGTASTVLRSYVAANIGPGARRAVPGLVVGPDPVAGNDVTGRARFPVLLDLLKDLALSGGDLGFRVVQVGTALQFQVYTPVDRTRTVILSPLLGTLAAFEYAVEPPTTNDVVVAGGGEGTARVFLEREGADSQEAFKRRVQTFRDRRDTSDPAEMGQTADEELAQGAARTSLSVTPIDTEGIQVGRDYWLGDRVTVVVTEEDADQDARPAVLDQIQDVVREIRLTLTPDRGEQITPTIGTPETQALNAQRVLAVVRGLAERVGGLERST